MCQKNRVRITRFDKSTMMMIYCVTGIHTTGKKAIISYYSVSVLRQLTPKIGGGLNMCMSSNISQRIVTICLAVQTLFTERLDPCYLSSLVVFIDSGSRIWRWSFTHNLSGHSPWMKNWDFFIISSSIFFIFIILNCSLLGILQLLLSTTLTSEAKIVNSRPLPWIPGR